MGCPKYLRDSGLEYQEAIVSPGRPISIDFQKRNRKIIGAFTHDPTLTVRWTPTTITIDGPIGTEAYVKFIIA